jgi:hypothetical protein
VIHPRNTSSQLWQSDRLFRPRAPRYGGRRYPRVLSTRMPIRRTRWATPVGRRRRARRQPARPHRETVPLILFLPNLPNLRTAMPHRPIGLGGRSRSAKYCSIHAATARAVARFRAYRSGSQVSSRDTSPLPFHLAKKRCRLRAQIVRQSPSRAADPFPTWSTSTRWS